ncbi:MAG: hypothetical protein ACWGHO_00740 [Candidatus Moraniibacteriota bacterium]
MSESKVKPITVGKSLRDVSTQAVGKDGKVDRTRVTKGDCVK